VIDRQFGSDTVERRPGGKEGDHRVARKEAQDQTVRSAAPEAVADQLAHAISHDLSQPLTTIVGFADLLERRYSGRLDSDASEFIGFIVAGTKRMQAMLDDLQAYLSVGENEPPAAPVDCSRVVQAAVDSLGTRMAETRATVTVGPLPHIRGDSAQIGQLFRQLLHNALKFRGDQAPRISITATRESGQVRFSIADNGRGMDPGWSERAFDLFESLHAPDPDLGTGAGLAICRKIVERHGGRIWFEPGVDRGSRFQFTIPERAPAAS
jgi:light-regulated signal transduction histidine kinase (bacteriophytochrome)